MTASLSGVVPQCTVPLKFGSRNRISPRRRRTVDTDETVEFLVHTPPRNTCHSSGINRQTGTRNFLQSVSGPMRRPSYEALLMQPQK